MPTGPMVLFLAGCAGEAPAWQVGELLVEQVAVGPATVGEAVLVVGPDGTAVLVDTGNDRQVDETRQALQRHLGEQRLDHVVLTHYHGDHLGGFEKLEPLVEGRVLCRGEVDFDDVNAGEYARAREATGGLDALDLGQATLDLGAGATLRGVAANGCVVDAGCLDIPPGGHAAENARSLVGTVTWGEFRYTFAGDLVAQEGDTPDVEAFVAAEAAPGLLEGTDVLHLNHHGLDDSSGPDWLARLLPLDGSPRHAVVGNTPAYAVSPSGDVLDRVVPRLASGEIWALARNPAAPWQGDLRVARGPVVVRVQEDGGYWLGDAREGAWWASE